ncbi:MAG: hypothetical protein JWQ16_1879 [Novosphingobium sp.]|nr:hypothetical protein [Novosphingobium sp.]
MSEDLLPEGFVALEPFVERWALASTAERAARRSASTCEERQLFFATAGPMVDAALAHLDTCPLNELTGPGQRLMNLMLGLAHVALAVEIQGPDEIKSAPWRDRMHISRSTADQGVQSCSN